MNIFLELKVALETKYFYSSIFISAKYLQMFTTYLLYNGETERLKLEFENFNKEYLNLRKKFNKMMNKLEDTEGNGDGDDAKKTI